ncbi:nitrate reductase [Bacteroidetes/Chlorobi group bacterium MS-B_bin-24]|jgi:thiosulfate reductase/polysulfide reductase chain A|nr:MAG: nitrate reductase [Bacteroidetes/Chlorobi group bacterium MS-B_bin-24]
METKVTRRKFLQITSATFAGAAILASSNRVVENAIAAAEKKNGVVKIPSYCSICFWKCGLIGYVKDGKLWKLEGNPLDPLSKGRLCPRGNGGVGQHYDPDRLKAPLVRISSRGEDSWNVTTWDEALSYSAKRLMEIKEKYGPQSIAVFSHGPGGVFLKHTMRAFGVKNFTAPSFAQCRGPREVAFELTYGELVGSPERTDIKNSKCFALIGSHLGENMHNTQVQEFAEAIERGATIIVVDPRFSIAASKAKYYLPIKPGTDTALLLAWINVLIQENLYDKEFVENYTFGFEPLREYIKPFTPEWAFAETGIQPDLIRETIRELARYKPASFVHPGRHVNWYGNDVQRLRAVAIVNALLGNWNRKGAFYKPVKMDIPKYPYPPYPEADYEVVYNPNSKYPFAGEDEGLTQGVRSATITGEPYPIKAWVVYGTNLIQTMPNPAETIEAIKKLDFLLVIDVIPNEIAMWADVVLPESIYLERFDELNISPFRIPFVGIRQPVVPPPHDQKDGWWIARELAVKLGLEKYYPWMHIEEYLKYRVEAAGLSYEQFKKDGVILGNEQPIYVEDGLKLEFPFTPSQKVELYSTQLAEKGFSPLPTYERPPEPPPGYFRLLFGRVPVHTFSMTQSNRILMDMVDENEVWVNSDVAETLVLKNGEYVYLKNQDGILSNKVKVRVTQRIRPDCVFMYHGFGHTSKNLKRAYLKGASDSELISRYDIDPIMGGTGMNNNFVTFVRE